LQAAARLVTAARAERDARTRRAAVAEEAAALAARRRRERGALLLAMHAEGQRLGRRLLLAGLRRPGDPSHL
jgi:hypothetical protein